ncbi:hypothetical protein DITRI_Ditri02bG0104800 [Diplodiscus trichospermus]
MLNSSLPHSKDCLPVPAFLRRRTISFSLYSICFVDDLLYELTQTFSRINIQNDTLEPIKNKDKAIIPALTFLTNKKSKKMIEKRTKPLYFCSFQILFSSSGLAEQTVDGEYGKAIDLVQILTMGGGVGNNGGKIYGGVGGGGRGSDGGDDDGGSRFFESNNHWSDSTDVYY